MTAALVRAERLTAGYGTAERAIEDVTLAVGAGELVGVVGPSGCGKTTLLRALLGTVRPSGGTVDRAPGLRAGYVPQVESVSWRFPVTVGECVLMARTRGRVLPWASGEEKARVREALGRLGIAALEGRHIGALSGGQQQRVFVARALLSEPQLLLLDEPTSGVDVKTRHELLHLLGELRDGGLAVVLTTHDLNGIAPHVRRLVCLNRRVIADGPPRDVLTPDVLEATYGARLDVLQHGGMPVVVDHPAVDRP